MKIARFRQPALSALAVLLISGAGIAFAGNGSSAAPAAAAPVVAPAAAPVVQERDQTTPDSAAEQAAETEKAGAETEKAGAEEPGDANLPGGGHADDPNDANADHQFEGVE
ncbi:MAG TPA: hypothetical protein VFK38_09375 [Candidatus Limnocylindrales bacterium]|nr:hypothetical protein [Candidatus Limnocylindrales bacterium]